MLSYSTPEGNGLCDWSHFPLIYGPNEKFYFFGSRLDEQYVFYYVNMTRFLVTLVVPFVSLVYLNNGIYR